MVFSYSYVSIQRPTSVSFRAHDRDRSRAAVVRVNFHLVSLDLSGAIAMIHRLAFVADMCPSNALV